MKISKKLIGAMIIGSTVLMSCNNDDNSSSSSKSNLEINLSGLESLGEGYVYEGWIIVDGKPISTGTFKDVKSSKTFSVDKKNLKAATKFVLSIEPADDKDPAPSATKVLVGDFSGSSASLTSSIVGDFSNISGKYILATPTNGSNTNENSGIWFLELPGPKKGLMLPQLPEGWTYEGWVVIDGKPVTTGKFTNPAATDKFDGFSGSMALGSPNGADGFFPGEDFLRNAPQGLTFPTDLSGGKAVISIEPVPDNSPMPFSIKPLVADIPAMAKDHMVYPMNTNLASLPKGTVKR